MRRSNRVYWLDNEHWACGRHLPAQVLPSSIERCWLCPNKRPSMADRPQPSKDGSSAIQAKTTKTKARRPARPKMIVARKAADLTATEAPASQNKGPTTSTQAGRKASSKSASASRATSKKTAARKAPLLTESSGGMCAWHECSKQARPRSKYCSRNCSNKNARARHKARK